MHFLIATYRGKTNSFHEADWVELRDADDESLAHFLGQRGQLSLNTEGSCQLVLEGGAKLQLMPSIEAELVLIEDIQEQLEVFNKLSSMSLPAVAYFKKDIPATSDYTVRLRGVFMRTRLCYEVCILQKGWFIHMLRQLFFDEAEAMRAAQSWIDKQNTPCVD